jgi:ABC-type oligopeptide transport system substrate-binding subunit
VVGFSPELSPQGYIPNPIVVEQTARGERQYDIYSRLLIDRIIFAKDRAELIAATKALDRVLLAYEFVVPQWTYGFSRTARWDRFSHPETMPTYGASAFPVIWWYDEAKALKTAASK